MEEERARIEREKATGKPMSNDNNTNTGKESTRPLRDTDMAIDTQDGDAEEDDETMMARAIAMSLEASKPAPTQSSTDQSQKDDNSSHK